MDGEDIPWIDGLEDDDDDNPLDPEDYDGDEWDPELEEHGETEAE